MPNSPTRITLRDGSHAYVRPIRPSDRELLARGFDRLSGESRYRRFFAPLKELSAGTLDYLTQVDHHGHEALIALSEDGEMVGVARYVRLEPDGPVAEAAITVIDDWQGRGVGRQLLRRLATRARQEGVRQFSALVKVENPTALDLLRGLGPSELSREADEFTLLIDLPKRGVGSKLARALRAAAAGTVSAADSLVRVARR